MMWRWSAFARFWLVSTDALVNAQTPIIGVASVVDGDTIEIHGTRIRLFGIDAPESSQLCVRPTGERWRCGQQASFALADRIGHATVSCQPRDLDRYYNKTRTHLSLDKDAPSSRAIQRYGAIVTTPILSGLHHCYSRM